MGLYKLNENDLLILEHAEKLLRKYSEHDEANDINLLRGRIKYMLKEQGQLEYIK